MAVAQRKIFRQRALDHHRQKQERNVLPPLVRPPILLFLWAMTVLLVASCATLWLAHIPTMVNVNGVVIQAQQQPASNQPAGGSQLQATNTPTANGLQPQPTITPTNDGSQTQPVDPSVGGPQPQPTDPSADGSQSQPGDTSSSDGSQSTDPSIDSSQSQSSNNLPTNIPKQQLPNSLSTNSSQPQPAKSNTGGVFAVLLLAPTQRGLLHEHMPVTLHLGNTGVTVQQSITVVESEVLGPDAIQQRFGLQGLQTQLLSGPQIVVLVYLGPAAVAQKLVGSICQADIQVGSQRVLSLIPGIGSIVPAQ